MKPPAVPRTIWALGFVSLFTDLGSEIVHSLLPVLLAGTLGASVFAIGLLEGAAEALVLITKVLSGYLSDAMGKRKPLVVLGYGLATLAKPLFPLAESVSTVVMARMVDRFGKGIRGAPRDALLGDLAPAEIRGACFGLRQSMDTLGAVLGPSLAIALLWDLSNDVSTVLWIAVIPGLIAVSLLLFIKEPEQPERPPARLPISREGLSRLGLAYWKLTALGALVALARFSEAFLVLRASEQGLGLTWIPLVLVVMSAVYALSAYPAGALSDRMPRHWLLGLGMVTLALANVALATAKGYGLLFLGIGLWGLHMGLTQGLLASLIVDIAPPEYRGTAFGVFNLFSGFGLLLASAMAGWLWDRSGSTATFWFGAGTATVATLAIPLLLGGARRGLGRA